MLTRDALNYFDQLNMEIYSASSQYFISSKYQDDWRNRSSFWDTHLKGLPCASRTGFGYIHCIPRHPQAISYQYIWHCLFFSTIKGRLALQLRQKAGTPEIQGKHSTLPQITMWICISNSPGLLILVYRLTHNSKPFRRMVVSCCKYAT